MSQYAFPGTNKSYRSSPAGPSPGQSLKPRLSRWYIPLVAAVGLGFGAYNYYTDLKARQQIAMIEEEQRLAENRMLMDAYGSKDNLEELQQALDAYASR